MCALFYSLSHQAGHSATVWRNPSIALRSCHLPQIDPISLLKKRRPSLFPPFQQLSDSTLGNFAPLPLSALTADCNVMVSALPVSALPSFRRRRCTRFSVGRDGVLHADPRLMRNNLAATSQRPFSLPRTSYLRVEPARSSKAALAFVVVERGKPDPVADAALAAADDELVQMLGERAKTPAVHARVMRAAGNKLFPLAFIRVVQQHAINADMKNSPRAAESVQRFARPVALCVGR